MVDAMREELKELQPVLREKAAVNKDLLLRVTTEQEQATEVMIQVKEEEADVKRSAAETQAMKDDAQQDLDEAMPAMNEAMESLGSLNKQDITEMRTFSKPPALVQKTMEAVCTLLGEKADWDTAKKVLGDVGLIKRLMDFDKDNVSDKMMRQLKRYIEDPQYTPDQVGPPTARRPNKRRTRVRTE